MKPGALLAVILAVCGVVAIVSSLLINSSPYVTVAQAQEMGSSVHLAGDLDRSSMTHIASKTRVTFDLIDEQGDRITVLYKGNPPANMGTATKVVAVGKVEDGVFHADRLLLKCPSKYESETLASR